MAAEMVQKGYPRGWWTQLSETRKADDVVGLEKVFCMLLVFLRIASLTYWFLSFIPDPAIVGAQHRHTRDRFIEFWVLVELLILVFLSRVPDSCLGIAWRIAAYILFTLFLSLFNIVFIAKIPEVNAPRASTERSLLLLGVNALQVVLSFAIFYRQSLDLDRDSALVSAILVLGTVGYPKGDGYLVALQVLLDLTLIALFISYLVGNLAAARRGNGE